MAGQQLVFSATPYAFYGAGLPRGQTTSYTVPAWVDTVSIYASYTPVDACDSLS